MYKVSVIVPVYNAELYLHECLDSILKQTYRILEVICINDGSKDNSGRILEEYANTDNRIKVIHQKNSGVSAARNRAMEVATGDYIMFIDSDDWIEKETINETLQYSISHRLDICSFSYISEHGKIHTKHALYKDSRIFDEHATKILARRIIGPIGKELKHPLMLDSYGTIWAKLYYRPIIAGLKFEDLKIIGSAEDSLFNMFAYHKAKRTGYLNKFFYHYRKTNDNAQTKKYHQHLQDKWKVQYKIIRNAFPDTNSQEALSNRIAINHYGSTLNLLSSDNPKMNIKALYNDPVFSEARKKLYTKDMTFFWRIFFTLVKHEQITLLIAFHRTVNFILKTLK